MKYCAQKYYKSGNIFFSEQIKLIITHKKGTHLRNQNLFCYYFKEYLFFSATVLPLNSHME